MNWPDRGRQRGYWLNIALGIDQGAGTRFGIDCDEYISSYVGRKLYGKWQYNFINWLFQNPNHCLESIEKQFVLEDTNV